MEFIEWPTIGDASESALIKFYQPIKDIVKTRKLNPLFILENK